MKLKFTKMHGLGNDFVVIDGVNQSVSLSPEQLRLLADRHFGVGCDQILLVEKATGDADINADFRYRIFNADGGEVEQCGNGCARLVLAVNKHNAPAIAACRRYGFEIERGMVDAIGGGFVVDDYLMVGRINHA